MAEIPEKLLVNIEVTQRKIEKQLAAIAKKAAAQAKGIEDDFTKANKGVVKSFGSSSFAAGNLAAQLNDIGVGLASGQSPFTVMIQQGSQVSQVLNQAGGNVAALKAVMLGAFSQMLNPISLATFAVIGLGGAAVGALSSMGSSAKSSEDILKEFNALVEEIGKTSKASADRIKEMLNTPESWAALRADAEKVSKDISSGMVDKIREATDRMQGFITPWQELTPEVLAAQQHIRELADDLETGRKTSQEVYDELSNMATADAYPPSLIDTINSLREIIKQATNAKAKLDALSLKTSRPAGPAMAEDMAARFGTVAGQQDRMASGVREKLTEQLRKQADEIANSYENTHMPDGGAIPTPTKKPSLLDYDPNKTSKSSGSGGSKTNPYQSGVQSIKDRKAALEAENKALAGINPLEKDYGAAVTKARITQQLLNDAERAHLEITPDLRASIDALAAGYTNASVESRKLAESQREAQRSAEEFRQLGKDVLGGFINDLASGKSAADALSDALGKIADKLLDIALNSIFDGSGGGSGLLSGIGKIFSFAGGGVMTQNGPRQLKRFASGGVAHQAAIFGEAGPEAAVPLPDGRSIPVTLKGSRAASGGVVYADHRTISIDARGAQQGVGAEIQKALSEYDRQTLPVRVKQIQQDPRMRG